MSPLTSIGDMGTLGERGTISGGPIDFRLCGFNDPDNNLTIAADSIRFDVTANSSERVWIETEISPSSMGVQIDFSIRIDNNVDFANTAIPVFCTDPNRGYAHQSYGAGVSFRSARLNYGPSYVNNGDIEATFVGDYSTDDLIHYRLEYDGYGYHRIGKYATRDYEEPQRRLRLNYNNGPALNYLYPLCALESTFNNPGSLSGEIRDMEIYEIETEPFA